jgi:hypothetical protein
MECFSVLSKTEGVWSLAFRFLLFYVVADVSANVVRLYRFRGWVEQTKANLLGLRDGKAATATGNVNRLNMSFYLFLVRCLIRHRIDFL